MAGKVRPKRGIVISLNLIRTVETLVCRICRKKMEASEKTYAKVIECIDPETKRWTCVIWPFCHHHLTESRHGLKAFVLRHQLPLNFVEGIPELIYHRGQGKPG